MQVGQFRQTKHERNLVDKSHNVWSRMVDFPVSPHLLYRKKVIVLRILEVHDQGILGDRLPAGKLYGNRDPITDVSAFLFIDLDEGLCGEMGLHLPDRLIHLQGIDPGIQTLECFPEGGLQEQFMIVASAKRATCPQDLFDNSKLHCSLFSRVYTAGDILLCDWALQGYRSTFLSPRASASIEGDHKLRQLLWSAGS